MLAHMDPELGQCSRWRSLKDCLKITVIRKRPGVRSSLEPSDGLAYPTTNCETSHFHDQIHSPGDTVIYIEKCAQKTLLHVPVPYLTDVPFQKRHHGLANAPRSGWQGTAPAIHNVHLSPPWALGLCSEIN